MWLKVCTNVLGSLGGSIYPQAPMREEKPGHDDESLQTLPDGDEENIATIDDNDSKRDE